MKYKIENKGFSLVELIIVIAIMAILSAALAPQLMKYIEKARVSADAQTCAAIEGCVNAALTNENVWNDMGIYRTGKFKFYIRMSDDGSQMLIQGLRGGARPKGCKAYVHHRQGEYGPPVSALNIRGCYQ